MQCTRCYTSMQLTKRENHADSFLEWHQCPLCKRVEFIAKPVRYEVELPDSPATSPDAPRPAYP